MSSFDDTFRPWKKLIDKKISDMNPCRECDIYEQYIEVAMYGSIAERQELSLPDTCRTCIKRTLWQMDCLHKLQWYEDNDPRLKEIKKE